MFRVRLMKSRAITSRTLHAAVLCGVYVASGTAWSVQAAEPRYAVQGGDVARGKAALQTRGCTLCHTVPGIDGAHGNVGPPLNRFGERGYVAGVLRNTPPNLVRWLRHPQAVVPGNAMPDMGIGEAEARDMAAFLYTLR